LLSKSRSRANKSNFAQPDEDRPAIRNPRTRGTDTFLTLPTETDQILMPCRVNRTFRLSEKLKISQQPNRTSGAQLSRLIPGRSLTRFADVISPTMTIPPSYLAFCLAIPPSTKAWAHISKIRRLLRGQHPASYLCMPSPHYSLFWPPLLDFPFGQGAILDFGTRRDDARPAR
jgi:hypothetical protein